MPVGELIAIGTELLLGEIQDTNTAAIARVFRDAGIDLYRATIVGDNPTRIAQAIREALSRSDIVITTGGLGPTVDDPTRQAAALALDENLEFRPDLWQQIQERFNRFNLNVTENNRRQAFIPAHASVIENEVGTAPAFSYERDGKILISLPGVPREMEHILHAKVMPLIRDKFSIHEIIKAYVLHAAGVGESQVDEWIGDLETHANPTVGLLAHPGQVDIRITVKAASDFEADAQIQKLADQIRQRVGSAIYGSNEETLEGAVEKELARLGWQIAVAACGLEEGLVEKLAAAGVMNRYIQSYLDRCTEEDIKSQAHDLLRRLPIQVAFGFRFAPGKEQQSLYCMVTTPDEDSETTRHYGGPSGNGPSWAVRTAMDFIRRNLESYK
jgi:competence/damage-inducible protein CinA-like protein